MRKYLLPKDGNFYKANLHMHTTVSDGNMSPEEVKRVYKEKGYSIVAFTDHEVLVPHNDLADDDFLPITSTEISVNKRKDCDFAFSKTYHLNLYSEDKNKDWFSVFSQNEMWLNHSYKYITKKQSEIEYMRSYTVESINDIIKKSTEEGFLVSYNHPVWSLQNYSDYIDLKGLWAIEWYNTGCVHEGYGDTIIPIDDLLKMGENAFPIATDDAHNINDCFGGFVMVKAQELRYDLIFKALKNGDFYSSLGPEIFELYIENGEIYIKTSKVKKIVISSERRYAKSKNITSSDEFVMATFDISDYLKASKLEENKSQYIRITIIDENGLNAHTRAYFLDELM